MKVLIVDDNEDARLILKKTLESAGHRVSEAGNGRDALDRARAEAPDLIISDILMPEMDGFRLCREVRQDAELKEIPFVFYTATYTDQKDEKLALALGADRFIRKPLAGDRFLAAIQGLTRQADRGELQGQEASLVREDDFLRTYNERLIHKLEKKILDLEAETAKRRQSEEQYRALVESSTDHIFMLSPDGTFLASNQCWVATRLDSGASLVGKQVGDYHTAEVAREYLDHVRQVVATGESVRFEHPSREPDGLHWHLDTLYPIKKEGEVRAVGGVCRDITELKRSQAEVAKQRDFLRTLLETLPNPVFHKDAEGRYTGCNRAFEEFTGLSRGDIVGKSVFDISPPELAAKYHEMDQELFDRSACQHYEWQVQHADGSLRDVLFDKAGIIDGTSRPAGLVGVITDITERKAAEDAVRASEAKYRELFENSLDAIAVTTPDGRFLDANRAFLDLYGYTRDEITRLNVVDTYVDPVVRADLIGQVRAKGVVRDHESRRLRKDGTEIICLVSVAANRDDSGEIVTLQSITRDVTQLRQLEQQYLQSQKMESVGQLAGGVAHDFNNMLSIIIGFSELTTAQMSRQDPLRRNIEEILNAARRSAELTRQLLAFARRQEIQPTVLDLNRQIEAHQSMLGRLIGEDIELQCRLQPDLGRVKMDPSQIDQILTNLAVNARDAIGGVGTLTIQTENVTLDEFYAREHLDCEPGDYVVLIVSDTGIGMSKEVREKIFEPFFTTKEVGQGTGLGLATVYGIVKQNHGALHVYSEPGHGTTFRIYLPRFQGEASVAGKAPAPVLERGDETVLVVEDERQVLGLCRAILERQGYHVLTADDPGKALSLCATHSGPLHLLITDVVMPTMSGKELKAQIQAMKPDLRVLFMSGYTADIIARRGILGEGVNFIQKPFSPIELAAKVRELLDR